jgi:hypothetical protein
MIGETNLSIFCLQIAININFFSRKINVVVPLALTLREDRQ